MDDLPDKLHLPSLRHRLSQRTAAERPGRWAELRTGGGPAPIALLPVLEEGRVAHAEGVSHCVINGPREDGTRGHLLHWVCVCVCVCIYCDLPVVYIEVREWHLSLLLYKLIVFVTCSITELSTLEPLPIYPFH